MKIDILSSCSARHELSSLDVVAGEEDLSGMKGLFISRTTGSYITLSTSWGMTSSAWL